ncbi:hypothetical protein BegalDRAFT_3246 [Beggiatoa alba B18LD]|uniref:Amino acid ABC transporter substrate-binding protein n=1 Tax=Beggiatoa alba B18LD TaxID=395493 RepID=I3CKC4_9GAMM|nr:hypothetical protein [Beggiatoa alba]EIJ44067.1 hypothetical protein BegalDRAFT_3246 [Beggiatoa alba B18LD]
MYTQLRFLLFIISLCAIMPVLAEENAQILRIGYLEQSDDVRYSAKHNDAQLHFQPWGRPYMGAIVAAKDVRFPLQALNINLMLEKSQGNTVDELMGELDKLYAKGVRFFLVDVPSTTLAQLGQRTKGKDILIFNISALDTNLRNEACQAHVLHLAPSWEMLTDAVAQYLISRKWRDVLELKGTNPDDIQLHEAFTRSAKRFGLKVIEVRDYVLGRDPRDREQNNVTLLTSNADYDVVFVADGTGDFARSVPYQTQFPRLVVGAAGLVPDWWHWSWERNGAPQVNGRFTKEGRRHGTGYDWSAWIGIKIIAEAIQRKNTLDFATLRDYIRSDEIVIDSVKGSRSSFRPWNNQLRQAIFLTADNWVVATAPLAGFMHQTNNLDTLGYDEKENRCHF